MFKDCKEWFESGSTTSGIYIINPDGQTPFEVINNIMYCIVYCPLQVYCDMETDGGGWSVFQRRQDGSVDFYLNWIDYEEGFGNLSGEFWLGLSKVHHLTSNGTNSLRVDLGDFENNTAYAQYSTFSIGDSTTEYTLNAGGYSGTAGDALVTDSSRSHVATRSNGMKFSTKDNDNDNIIASCAYIWKGAWWFNGCMQSHLNAPYHPNGGPVSSSSGVLWFDWKGGTYSLKLTEMKVRRN